MTRLMIIDDEEEIRQGIINIIDWESNGIRICGEASNGKQALGLVRDIHPDIVLVDIRMPVMDGLQFLEAINAAGLTIRAIVLSGYDDFAYARKALKLGVSDYLLKPCRPEEILNTVLKVKASIEAEESKNTFLEHLKSQFAENLPVLKERYMNRLIKGKAGKADKAGNPGRISDTPDFLKIDLAPEHMLALVMKIDNIQSAGDSDPDTELMKFAVKNIAEEIFKKDFNCEVFECDSDITAVLSGSCGLSLDNLNRSLNEIRTAVKKHLGLTVSAGLGRVYGGISNLHLSFAEACEAIKSVFFAGENAVIGYEDIKDSCTEKGDYPLDQEKEILRCIKSGDADGLHAALDDFFPAPDSAGAEKESLINSGLALVLSLYHFCIEMNIDTGEIFGNGFPELASIQKLDSLEKLKDSVGGIARTVFEKAGIKKSGNKIIESALKYIGQNYGSDLSLETVAGSVYITPGYLSLLFKQVMGINFVEYLHKVRIEKACELLKDSRLKVYAVSRMTGFNDMKYFSQIFKRITGVTPSEYRDRM